MRAYVIDDDLEFRRSLAQVLDVHDWTVTEFADAMAFRERAQLLEPGVVFLDLRMPVLGGLRLLEVGSLEKFSTIVLTGHGDVRTAVRAMKLGAVDFLEKPFLTADLLSLAISAWESLKHRVSAAQERLRTDSLLAALSARERQVLDGILAGGSNKHIARDLTLSVRTVELYRARMMAKLEVRGTTDLVRFVGVRQMECADNTFKPVALPD